MRRVGIVCLLAIVFAACGKKSPAGPSNNPPTNTTPTPTVVSLAVSAAPDLMFVGATQALTATATLSNGTTAVVSPRWTVDPAVVGTVANNIFSAAGSGEATITAEHEGARATTRTRVLPNVGGVWDGRFSITSCNATLDFRGACDDEELNKVYRFDFDLTQDRDSVTGTLGVFVDLDIPGSGSIATDGLLSMTGLAAFTESGVQFEYRVANWQSRTTANSGMTGTFEVVLTAPKFQGELRWMCDMPTATKTVSRSQADSSDGPAKRRVPVVTLP